MRATSIVESRALIDNNINLKTSDMHYVYNSETHEYELVNGRDISVTDNLFSFRKGYTIPAWSEKRLKELAAEYQDSEEEKYIILCSIITEILEHMQD